MSTGGLEQGAGSPCILVVSNGSIPFQIRLALLLYLTTIPAGLAVVTFVFTAFKPNYRCSIPQCEEKVGNISLLL